jgi:hypothetical protein
MVFTVVMDEYARFSRRKSIEYKSVLIVHEDRFQWADLTEALMIE